MIIPYYDEFGMYTSSDEIEIFIKKLVEQGVNNDNIVFSKCVEQFGQEFSNIIEYILYGKD